jgi:hypothetical protein
MKDFRIGGGGGRGVNARSQGWVSHRMVPSCLVGIEFLECELIGCGVWSGMSWTETGTGVLGRLLLLLSGRWREGGVVSRLAGDGDR